MSERFSDLSTRKSQVKFLSIDYDLEALDLDAMRSYVGGVSDTEGDQVVTLTQKLAAMETEIQEFQKKIESSMDEEKSAVNEKFATMDSSVSLKIEEVFNSTAQQAVEFSATLKTELAAMESKNKDLSLSMDQRLADLKG